MAERRDSGSSAGDSLLVLGSRVAAVLVGVGIQSSLAWLLLPEGRGSYAVCVLLGSVLAVVFAVGLDKSVQYQVSTSRMTLSEGVGNALGITGLAGALAVAGGLALMRLDLGLWAKAERHSFGLALGFVPISILNLALQWALIAARNFRQVAISTTLAALIQLAGVLGLVGGFAMGVDGALVALMASTSASSLYAYLALRRDNGLAWKAPTARGMLELLRFGSRYYVASLGYMTNTRIGIVLIALVLSPEEIGYFAAAVGVITQAVMIADSVETAVLPRMAENEEMRIELAGRAARMSALATGIPLAIFAVFCRPIVGLLFSREFLPSVPLILIVMPGVFLWSAGKILLGYFLSCGRPGVASWAIGVGIAANVVALLVLLPEYKLVGAAWAMSLGFAARWLVAVWAFHAISGAGILSTWLPRRQDFGFMRRLFRDGLSRLGVGE